MEELQPSRGSGTFLCTTYENERSELGVISITLQSLIKKIFFKSGPGQGKVIKLTCITGFKFVQYVFFLTSFAAPHSYPGGGSDAPKAGLQLQINQRRRKGGGGRRKSSPAVFPT